MAFIFINFERDSLGKWGWERRGEEVDGGEKKYINVEGEEGWQKK